MFNTLLVAILTIYLCSIFLETMSFCIHFNNNHDAGFDGSFRFILFYFFFLMCTLYSFCKMQLEQTDYMFILILLILDCNLNFSNFHFCGYTYSSPENNTVLVSGMI